MSACVFKNASPIYTYSSNFLAKDKEKKGVKDLHNIVYKIYSIFQMITFHVSPETHYILQK